MKGFNTSKMAALVVLTLLITGCKSTGQGSAKGKEGSEVKITVDINSEDGAFWMVYGLTTSACSEDYPFYSFGEFYCAFSMANTFNTKSAQKGDEPVTAFSIDLQKITAAGYFKEYAFHYYNQAQWFAEPGLKTEAFKQWMASELPNHKKGQMGASVEGRVARDKPPGNPPSVQLDPTFMKESGPIHFVSKQILADPSLGLRLRYVDDNQSDFYADVFVYPKPNLPQQTPPRNYLVDKMSLVKYAILYYVQHGDYNNYQVVSEQLEQEGTFAKGVYHVEQNRKPIETVAYLTEHEGVLIKVRSSHPRSANVAYEEAIKAVIEDLKTRVSLSE